MNNPTKDFLLRFIQGISNNSIFEVLKEVIESSFFAKKVAEKTGLMPVWAIYYIHTSQLGNRHKTQIVKAFKNGKGAADFIYSQALAGKPVNNYSLEIIFIDQASEELYYSTRQNTIGYWNYYEYYSNKETAAASASDNIKIEQVVIE
ncbi:MAG: hypothetical protein H6576_03985 [Lewinellaceae bacterium]|nr:hypothetical protein [Saprospiraceae bacterium]MCB9342827.1 hypothetical protein [Lewinellaceae bacterium]